MNLNQTGFESGKAALVETFKRALTSTSSNLKKSILKSSSNIGNMAHRGL